MISASSKEVDGIEYYSMDYVVKSNKFERRNISVYTSRYDWLRRPWGVVLSALVLRLMIDESD